MDDHLNDDFFSRLAAKMPGFKREIAKKFQAKKASGNGKLKQPPCTICGKHFGSKLAEFSLQTFTPKPFCPTCQGRLDEGCCAMVNEAGTRFVFVKFKVENTDEPSWAGTVKTVTDQFLDLVEQHAAGEKAPDV